MLSAIRIYNFELNVMPCLRNSTHIFHAFRTNVATFLLLFNIQIDIILFFSPPSCVASHFRFRPFVIRRWCWHKFFCDLVNNRDWCCRCFAIATVYMYLTQSSVVHAACMLLVRIAQGGAERAQNNNDDNTNTTQYTCAINKIGLNAFIHIISLLFSSFAFVRAKWAFFCAYMLRILSTENGYIVTQYTHYAHVFRSDIFLPIQLSLGFWHLVMLEIKTYVVCKIQKYFF